MQIIYWKLTPTTITLETAEGLTTTTNIVVTICLLLTDNINVNHVYIIPGCVFDSESTINILGIPTLVKFFGYNWDVYIPLLEDGTTIKLGAIKSHFLWYHGNHKCRFMHSSIQMPELYQYFGYGYCTAFCTRIHKLQGDKVHYVFSLDYFVDPNTNVSVTPNTQVIPCEEGYLN